MENGELEILTSAEFREAVEQNIERNPNDIALDGRVPHPRLVATEVKNLQRASRKLPSYYAARAILPTLATQQASSEECAAYKRFSGALAVDLTCGLGVDSLYLSRRFERVVAIEHNPTLAAITRHNLRLLGADNVEVLSGESEELLATIPHADLIYADPDRRSAEGRKMVCLEDCSPNIAALLPTLKERADHIAVKLSPMFDTTEALKQFGPGSDVEVISLGGEVKEVVVYWSRENSNPTIGATALGVGSFEVAVGAAAPASTVPFVADKYSYLVVPDAALRKAGLTAHWCAAAGIDLHGAYGFSSERPTAPLGHTYNIIGAHPYQPKRLKSLAGRKVEIIRHGFSLPTSAILKALGAQEGAGTRWAFAEIGGDRWAFQIEEIK